MTYGLSVMMLKSLKLSLTISVTLILFICYFTKEAHDGNIWACPNGCCLLSELRKMHRNSILYQLPPEDLLPCIA